MQPTLQAFPYKELFLRLSGRAQIGARANEVAAPPHPASSIFFASLQFARGQIAEKPLNTGTLATWVLVI